MKNPVFINSDEILLAMCENGYGNAQAGPLLEEKEILDFIDDCDNAIQILRIDRSTNRYDDISEEIAELYIEHNERLCFENKIPHDFVKHSDAYDEYLDDLKKQEYEDKTFGTYEQQNKLKLSDVI
ncbi:hypothetical protein [Bartonella rattaustraliani]|uniref:hypothetical protein n=1 Tax=Bartonella rattaustraliani TaxID=481139 RepID=UPI0002EDA212|nr:hypothetical protein [Bartonella rattaustraliani]